MDFGSGSAASEEEFGSGRRLTLPGFSLGSAAEVLDDDASEEGDGVEVGFGFGDGYDFGAAAGTGEALFKSVSDEATAGIAVEACDQNSERPMKPLTRLQQEAIKLRKIRLNQPPVPYEQAIKQFEEHPPSGPACQRSRPGAGRTLHSGLAEDFRTTQLGPGVLSL